MKLKHVVVDLIVGDFLIVGKTLLDLFRGLEMDAAKLGDFLLQFLDIEGAKFRQLKHRDSELEVLNGFFLLHLGLVGFSYGLVHLCGLLILSKHFVQLYGLQKGLDLLLSVLEHLIRGGELL